MHIQIEGNYVDFVDEITSMLGKWFGQIVPRKSQNEVVKIFVALDLCEFPSVESATLPAGGDPASDYRDKVFSMLQLAFGQHAVTNAQSLHEETVEDYRKRPVKRVQINAFMVHGVSVNVEGQQCRSQNDRGKRTIWTFDINADRSNDKILRERTLIVRDALVAYMHGIESGMGRLERKNGYDYVSSDGN